MRKTFTSKDLAIELVNIAAIKKAEDPVILDVRGVATFCDYFVIVSAQIPRQARAIYDLIIKQASKQGFKVHHREDDELDRWLLVDFFDVVIHIFTHEAREFYDLSNLWCDAKRVRIPKQKSHE
ncbi:MAG: ribosome silencing factor [Candidatus Omnitrophica bacterium]|nr:ribosome silencing factor [Candidatus Omnitrophota bacterium]